MLGSARVEVCAGFCRHYHLCEPGAARVARMNLVLPRHPAGSRLPDRWYQVAEHHRPECSKPDHRPDHPPVGDRPAPEGLDDEPSQEDQDVWPPGHKRQIEHHSWGRRGIGGAERERDECGHGDHLTSLRCHGGNRDCQTEQSGGSTGLGTNSKKLYEPFVTHIEYYFLRTRKYSIQFLQQ